ncbi:dihydroorotate dehydrogenase [Candidatus Woesearchaeota archaeon]|nr:dihydroorotate dehydrogenase [Candidatus Woesearchaeota archaeon]
MVDITAKLGRLKLDNPTVLASGILGVTKASLKYVASNGAGAVTMKSVTVEPRAGHHAPIILTYEGGMLNSVGYSNQGIKEAKKEFISLKDVGAPVIASITAGSKKDFAFLAEQVNEMGFAAVEAVISCPHTPGFGTMAGQGTPDSTREITAAVRDKTKLPLFVKLSPSVQGIGEVAKAAEDAGADAITAINTGGPGMIIDVKTGKPILGGTVGGLSGDALRPIAVRCVYDIYKSVRIPIIGTGGVMTGEHAAQMILAGASAVGIGTAVYYRGADVFRKVCDELQGVMKEAGYKNIYGMRGMAHEE